MSTALAALASLASACRADTPGLTDAGGGGAIDCTPYADLVVAFTDGDGMAAPAEAALGAPDDATVSVAPNAILTLGFLGLGAVVDQEEIGEDIRVHGTVAGETEVTVLLSMDGEVWETAGTIGTSPEGATDLEIDLAATGSIQAATFLQLVGVAGALAVDSVEALQTSCVSPVR